MTDVGVSSSTLVGKQGGFCILVKYTVPFFGKRSFDRKEWSKPRSAYVRMPVYFQLTSLQTLWRVKVEVVLVS